MVLHEGFDFPESFLRLTSAPETVNGQVVHWTIGALLYRTRFLPLRYECFSILGNHTLLGILNALHLSVGKEKAKIAIFSQTLLFPTFNSPNLNFSPLKYCHKFFPISPFCTFQFTKIALKMKKKPKRKQANSSRLANFF